MNNGLVVSENGTKFWYLNGELHRDDGGPAMEFANGEKIWYLNGVRHREGGPAVEWANGNKYWFLNGELHREDGPAIKYTSGSKFWYLNGVRHHEGGPAIKYASGFKCWYLNGVELIHPECFESMEEWFQYLNDNESESYQVIHDIKGIISFINNPSGKQTRIHQMAHLL